MRLVSVFFLLPLASASESQQTCTRNSRSGRKDENYKTLVARQKAFMLSKHLLTLLFRE
jgi:hypothetical protein